MRTTNNNSKSKFLAFLLSVMMVSSAGALFASCDDTSDDSSSSITSEETEDPKKDTGDIKNANFDFTTTSNTTVIGTSVTGWSRSVYSTSSGSANSSKSASGVIDTSKWDYLTTTTYTQEELEAMSDAEAKEKWDTFQVKDKLAYYDIWKAREANKDKSISKDFAAYESINIDEEDIPTVENPGTVEGTEDSNVLMIHNNYYPKTDKFVGTAQKYTSSSTVTIPAGTSKKVTVWVNTADLKSAASDGTVQDAVGKGAYISLTHSVGGKALDAYEVKNINTDGEWVDYTFYIKGSYYADTTFSLVLGLGQGSTTDRLDYVNGYAFFDNITVEDIEASDFETETAGLKVVELEDEKIDKTVDAFEKDGRKFAMNFYGEADAWKNVALGTITGTPTTSSDTSKVNPEAAATDVASVFANQAAIESAAASNQYLGYVYDNFFKDTDFVENNEVLMFLSTNGTAYTAEKAMSFTMEADKNFMAISFFVKTSDLNGGTGAGITLVDGLNKTAFAAIDTSDLAGVKVGDDEDAYDGWQQVFFFVERGEDTVGDQTFYLTFNYGMTDITSAAGKASFTQGFAAFSKFTAYTDMTELEYEAAATGTYAKKVTLVGTEEDKAEGNNGFDTAVGVPSGALEEGMANPQNYKGVYNDNYRVKLPETAADFEDEASKRAYNNYNGEAGLINRDEFANYFDTNTDAWLASLKASSGKTTAADVWAYHFGDATQPLVIMNDTAATKPYGFIGTSKSTSDEYTAVSLRVKTHNATASVYLMDMDDETRQSVLSVSRSLTYWYDDEGNICTSDPSKKTTIAFKLQKNGLYKANKNWEGYEKLGAVKDEYFANLSAYTESDGILYAAEDSASHDYYDYKWNREVFYKGTDGYYTEANNGGVKVIDLETITNTNGHSGLLEARYEAEAAQELKIENINTNGKWAYVTFYIRKGASAKNYRLEVWSGTRGGDVNTTAGGYVAFDTNNPGSASTNFALYEDYEDIAGINKFEGVFSYYDTDKHVRYDADLDTDKSGNVYSDYTSSSYTASIAYLAYLNNNYTADDDALYYNIFADYSVSDQTVAAKVETDDDTTEDSEDEETESELNVWLLTSSIAVAAVLVLAVASIIVRKVIENYKKKHGSKARKVVKEKKAPTVKKVEKTVDEDSPYND